MKNDNIRDIHYVDNRLKRQREQLRLDSSDSNYQNWLIYENWLIGTGRKTNTVLKHLGAFKRVMRLYTIEDLKNITQNQIIELNSKIVLSDYVTTTKVGMQLIVRSFITLSSDDSRKKEVFSIIKLLSEERDDTPDKDEFGKVISHSDFNKIESHMPNEQFKIMSKILYATGMRITEVYNIIPKNVEFIKKKLFGFNLPIKIFGYKCAWIYTYGKRTKSKREGRYMYYMDTYLNDFKEYLNTVDDNEYICNYSYSYYLQSLHNAVDNADINYNVYPHMFRHTAATRLFKKHPDAVVKKIMNWSKNSNMSRHYSHLNKNDIELAMRKV